MADRCHTGMLLVRHRRSLTRGLIASAKGVILVQLNVRDITSWLSFHVCIHRHFISVISLRCQFLPFF